MIRRLAPTLLLIAAVLATSPSDAARENWPKRASIGTAPIGGTYYIWGAAFAQIMEAKLGLPTTVEVTQGPVPNLKLVEAGQQTFGIATNGVIYDAYRGLAWAQGKKHENLRVMLPMYASYFHCIALSKHNVKSVRDLEGKPVGAGAKGGTPDIYFRRIIDAMGVKPSRIVNLGFEDMNNQTKDGVIVGYCTNTGPPQASLTELETTHDVRIFGLDAEDAKKVQAKFPYMIPDALPAGIYKSAREAMPTIAGFNMLVVNKNLPEDFVHAAVKATYESQDRLIAAHPSGKELPPARMAQSPAPLHVGAVKYFTEKGVKLPAEVIPPEAKK